jgi:NitT/TauT family transport system substrate-binding protein/putative hydroxymethylpyrimidine transport system substrate-binding protein
VNRRILHALVPALCAALLVSCGGDDGGAGQGRPTVVLSLDFVPNAVHAPIYMAVEDGRDRAHGIRLDIREPAGGPDALKLVAGGRADLGVLDIHDLALAREQHADLVAIGALVGRPLAALVARPGITRPRDLEGKTVGVSGLPSDPAFLRAILDHDGADYDRVRQVTIGFSAVSRLLSGRVDAVPAFWSAEGVALKRRGLPVREFRVDDYGAPPYPEVVFFTSRRTLDSRADRVRRALAAVEDGLRDTLADPQKATLVIAHAADTRDTGLVRAQLDAISPVFARGLRLDPAVIERWADFDALIGIVPHRPDVRAAFDFQLAPGS